MQESTHPPAYETSAVPFWNILFIFNHLLMHKKDLPTQSIATLLPIQIIKLNQGQLRELFDEVFAFPDLTASPQPNLVTNEEELSFGNATQFCPEAQAAANSDNLHTAFQRVLSTSPVTKNYTLNWWSKSNAPYSLQDEHSDPQIRSLPHAP
jgi:hypothetical protein